MPRRVIWKVTQYFCSGKLELLLVRDASFLHNKLSVIPAVNYGKRKCIFKYCSSTYWNSNVAILKYILSLQHACIHNDKLWHTNNFFHLYLGTSRTGPIPFSNLVQASVPLSSTFDATHCTTWDFLWDTVRSNTSHCRAAACNFLRSYNFVVKSVNFVCCINQVPC